MTLVLGPEEVEQGTQFNSLVEEFKSRGFDYFEDPKAESYLNDGYLIDICEAEDWPFLEAEVLGEAPLEITDVRSVEYVVDVPQMTKLAPLERRWLTDGSVDLEEEGTPTYYYLDAGRILTTFPSSADELRVRYFAIPPRLEGEAYPVLPARWHSLIVDAAVARAYADSDDFELERNAEEAFQRRLNRMREGLLDVYRDGPSQFITVTNPDAMC